MKRIAMIADGAVESVAAWDGSPWDPGCVLVDVTDQPAVGPGWLYDGAAFTAPAPAEPAPETIEPAPPAEG